MVVTAWIGGDSIGCGIATSPQPAPGTLTRARCPRDGCCRPGAWHPSWRLEMHPERTAQNGRIAVPCVACGQMMYRWPSESTRKFCDRACFRWYLGTDAALLERFWAKVDQSAGPEACWPYLGGRVPFGYGRIAKNGGGYVYTHRL